MITEAASEVRQHAHLLRQDIVCPVTTHCVSPPPQTQASVTAGGQDSWWEVVQAHLWWLQAQPRHSVPISRVSHWVDHHKESTHTPTS